MGKCLDNANTHVKIIIDQENINQRAAEASDSETSTLTSNPSDVLNADKEGAGKETIKENIDMTNVGSASTMHGVLRDLRTD
jgi:hypothetical protein